MATQGIGWGDPDERQIERSRALAQQLVQRSQTPLQGQMAGQVYVPPHWTQQLANTLSGVLGDKIERDTDQREKALGESRRTALAEGLKNFNTTYNGTPGQQVAPAVPNDDEGNAYPMIQAPGTPGDPRAAYAQLLASNVPQLQQLGSQGLSQLPALEAKKVERDEDRAWRTEESKLTRDARAAEAQAQREAREQELRMRLEDARISRQERADLQRELQASQLQGQKELRALVASQRQPEAPVAVVGPDGNPVYVTRSEALGKTPAKGDGAEKPLTDAQSKALLFGSRMQSANETLDALAKDGTTTSIPGARTGFGVGATLNVLSSAKQQQLNQAKRDFVNAVLRRESGAVIADSEFSNADQQYFPQVGDSKEVVAQKKRNREIAMRGIMAEVPKTHWGKFAEVAGPTPGAPSTGGASGAWPAAESDPLGLRGR